jgi:tetratricopeptide (TPR) repeat protein
MVEFELKSISKDAVPEALERAHRYRLLNEPWQAESICLDVLQIEPANKTALITLLLALTDQFDQQPVTSRAREVLASLDSEYDRAYYSGIILERSARAHLKQNLPELSFIAEEFLDAMDCYEKAQAVRPEGNDESILRWNTCARTLMRHSELRLRAKETLESVLDD